MGEINLDAGESTKIIAESVDAVEEFVESVSGEIFVSEKSTVPSTSADPIPEGDRTHITAREGTPVYARAAPRGNGATVRVGNADNNINVQREQRRTIERPGDRAIRRGKIKTEKFDSRQLGGNASGAAINTQDLEPNVAIDRVTVIPDNPSNANSYIWTLNIPKNLADSRDFGAVQDSRGGQTRGYDPGLCIPGETEWQLLIENKNANQRTFRGAVVYRTGI